MEEVRETRKEKSRLGDFIRKRKMMVLAATGIVVGGIVFFGYRSSHAQTIVKAENSVSTTTLKKRDLTKSVSVTGTIASADKREVVADMKDTQIGEVRVSVGDYVNKGDTVLVFDDTELKEAYEETQSEYELNSIKQNQSLSQAQEKVDEAQDSYQKGFSEQEMLVSEALSDYQSAQAKEAEALSSYQEAQNNTRKAKEAYEKLKEKKSKYKSALEKAKKTDDEKKKALEEAKTAFETAETNIKYAAETDENHQALKDIYTSTYQAYTTAQAEADAASGDYEKAQKEYDAIEEAEKAYEEAKEKENAAKSAYEEASSNVSSRSGQYNNALQTQSDTNEKNEKNISDSKESLSVTSAEVSANLTSQKKQVVKAQEKLGECVLSAPISGYVTQINVEEGDTYNGTDALFVIQDMENFVVEATVDEYDIAALKKDQQAVIKTDATGELELNGIVSYVALTPDASTSSMGNSTSGSNYSIRIDLTEQNEDLRVGMTAKTSIVLESAKEVFAVAYDCIETDREGNSYITVLEGDSAQSDAKEASKEKRKESSEKDTKDNNANIKKIKVEQGIESDYYVEIKSDELQEGMQVVTPQTTTAAKDTKQETEKNGFEMPGMLGGSMSQGGSRPNGNSSGQSRGGYPGGSR